MLSSEHLDITLNPIDPAFSSVSPVLDLSDSPNTEFLNNCNLRSTVDILADEFVATEIDHKESDTEGGVYQEIYFHVMTTHDMFTTLVTIKSMKLNYK